VGQPEYLFPFRMYEVNHDSSPHGSQCTACDLVSSNARRYDGSG
jgi:hypothetical protein